MRHSSREFILVEAEKLGVDQRVVYGFVSQNFFDVENVFCFVIFNCGLPMAESVKGNLVYSRIFEFSCYSFALTRKVSPHNICIAVENPSCIFQCCA